MPSDPLPGSVPPGLDFFYVPPAAIHGGTATVEGIECDHLARVLRHREGDTIGIVDGIGGAYVATVTTLGKHAALCALRSDHPGLHESARNVTLAVGLLKNPSRFDTLVEKSTELGVRRIVPLITERAIPRHGRIDRWRTIALAAMKQCGRCVLPEITPPTALDAVLASGPDARILLHEQADYPWHQPGADDAPREWVICIGPEGGFSDEEVHRARDLAWQVVSLGSRRLRSETAAIVAAARVLTM